ncbi:hypothetical protein Tco_0662245 [Tanacetum coccineum]
MPIFHMSMFKVPSGILRILELIRCHFFNGYDVSSKKASWVQWNKVLASKDNSGLGVSSLYALNRGLMFKWVWRFLSQDSSLWSRVIKAIHGGDENIGVGSRNGTNSCSECTLVNEINVLFFSERGKRTSTDELLDIKWEMLTLPCFWEDIGIGWRKTLKTDFLEEPRGGVEQTQMDELAAAMQSVILTPMQDRWTWSLNSSGEFSVASVRNLIDLRLLPKGDYSGQDGFGCCK